MRSVLAIADEEEEYAHRLMEYLSGKNAFLFQAMAFSREDSLCDYADANPIAILLLSENMISERTMKIKAEKRIIVREKRENGHVGEPSVYKYQAADSLLKEVMSLYDAENAVLGETALWRGRRRIIGIYSPMGGTNKTAFALALAQLYARERAVLYINLEGFSGLSRMIGEEFTAGLSDFLYYVRQKNADPLGKLSLLTVSRQNLDILPPADSPEDLRSISAGKWIELFGKIMSASSYEVMILDLGCEIDDIALIAGYCSSFYVPVRDDPVSAVQAEEFAAYLKAHGSPELAPRFLHLPRPTAETPGSTYFENLVWGELGEYARGLINEEEQLGQQQNRTV